MRRIVRLRRIRGVAEIPSYNTVYRCLQPGRARLDVELVVDIAHALLDDDSRAAQWRQAHRAAAGIADDSAIVAATTALPDDDGTFCGRQRELREILDHVDGAGTVVSIDGMAGVGKSRLAARAARMLLDRDRAGDLRLVVNLRAHDAEHAPADPAAVLDAFLRLLGVPGRRIQCLDLAERTTLYRKLMADRRALVLLDNAASSSQVLPLLPNGSPCLTIVTSRLDLSDLSAAKRIGLDVLPSDAALELLRQQAGAKRVDADPDSAVAIADCVGRLPLALTLVARRVNAAPDWTLADQLYRLAERQKRLQLEDGVEVALGVSYEELSPLQQRLLRLLSLHPAQDCDAVGAAALLDAEPTAAHRLLGELVTSNLVQRRAADRYELHNLVRVFAAGRARDEDPVGTRRAALTRLLDQQRYLASVAARRYAPFESPRLPAFDPPSSTTPPAAVDGEAARSWFDRHWVSVVAMAVYAAEHGWPDHCVHLSLFLARYLDTNAHTRDALLLHDVASRVCAHADRGHVLSNLGTALWRLSRHPAAVACYQDALAAARETGDPAVQSRALDNLGLGLRALGRYDEALDHHQRALEIKALEAEPLGRTLNNIGLVLRDLGRYDEALDRLLHVLTAPETDRAALASAHNNIGLTCRELGDDAAALEHHRRALEIARESGSRVIEGHSLDNIGCVYERAGRPAHAVGYHKTAIEILRDIGDRTGESEALTHLGRALTRTGQATDAIECHERALDIARSTGHRESEIEALNELGTTLRIVGRARRAAARHGEALEIASRLGHRYLQARAYDGLGAAARAEGDLTAARTHWAAALARHRELGTPEAETVARQLGRCPTSSASDSSGWTPGPGGAV